MKAGLDRSAAISESSVAKVHASLPNGDFGAWVCVAAGGGPSTISSLTVGAGAASSASASGADDEVDAAVVDGAAADTEAEAGVDETVADESVSEPQAVSKTAAAARATGRTRSRRTRGPLFGYESVTQDIAGVVRRVTSSRSPGSSGLRPTGVA
ncbi:hypothetical protein GCM10007298_22680 [Williamsia phyllosphaerae]|uniref:Uncharacterized protein n=1 Tax=Williamsia phyllosphaerae TaxID=885042 RepID=A0ABQ1USS9_9NOCA|nr:hypothetical protein GCM10007298_22680 [Williamsia phyllosphaerae]